MARRKKTPADLPPLAMAPEALARSEAAAPEVVAWVARNIDNPCPDPEECPDPFAWTLLRQCRRSPEVTVWFTEKLWSKLIPSRSQLDTKADAELDGKPTLELIERIQAIREAAEAKNPRIVPAAFAEPPPNAFAAFDPEKDSI